jgi:hypothetical protein
MSLIHPAAIARRFCSVAVIVVKITGLWQDVNSIIKKSRKN